jgi:hypothetical protein
MTYANVVSTLCLFLVLGGTSYAVIKLPRNSVKGPQIAPNAVTSPKVKNGSLLAADFAAGELRSVAGPRGADGAPGADATAPAGAVMFFNRPACPSGWTVMTAARGRYVVGLPAGGTLAGTAGSALTDLENRPVGQHTHVLIDPQHGHNASTGWGYDAAAISGTLRRPLFGFRPDDTSNPDVPVVASSATGMSVANAGDVPGTNAPYVQLLVCEKS